MASASVWHLTDPAATAAAADEQLTEKLLPLAVGLYRSEALAPTLQQYKCNAGEEVKEAVREVVQQVLPVLLSSCGDSLPLQGGGGHGEVYAWEQVQVRVDRGVFCQVAGLLVVFIWQGSVLQLRVRLHQGYAVIVTWHGCVMMSAPAAAAQAAGGVDVAWLWL